ncbi:MAG: DoxX family protein [Mycobacterium sp.]|nr:DoxX family protein [Mycobacterium sp.]
MSVLTSPKTYAALALFQAGDAAACAVPVAPIAKALNDVNFPLEYRWVLVGAKASAAIGLLSVTRSPALARLTTAMLALYFTLAVSAHIRAHDKPQNAAPAVLFLALFTAMTAKGPDAVE